MARYRYKSYRRRPSRRRKQLYYALALAAIVVVFFLIRSGGKERAEESPQQVGVEGLPSSGLQSLNPAANILETTLKPEPVPKLISTLQADAEPNLLRAAGENAKATAIIDQATQDFSEGRIIEARDKLNEVLGMPLTALQRTVVKERLATLADKWLFSRDNYPGDRLCGRYKVGPGGMLSDIAKSYKVPYEALLRINNIPRPEALQAGETIKVINGPFNAIVYRSSFIMDLYLQNTYVRSFKVGLGSPDRPTPTGLWQVKEGGKLIKPNWTDPDTGRLYAGSDPDYPLGSRWVGLEGMQGSAKGRTGFAIHGTKNPEEIGQASSRGCIRLHNGDAVLVYSLLVPVYSELRVVD
jgi:hypothetical protein